MWRYSGFSAGIIFLIDLNGAKGRHASQNLTNESSLPPSKASSHGSANSPMLKALAFSQPHQIT